MDYRKEQVTRFITDDDNSFDTETEAKQYCEVLDLEDAFIDSLLDDYIDFDELKGHYSSSAIKEASKLLADLAKHQKAKGE